MYENLAVMFCLVVLFLYWDISVAQLLFFLLTFRFAYIEFADKESVRTAMALDESLFRGRQIKVRDAHSERSTNQLKLQHDLNFWKIDR